MSDTYFHCSKCNQNITPVIRGYMPHYSVLCPDCGSLLGIVNHATMMSIEGKKARAKQKKEWESKRRNKNDRR